MWIDIKDELPRELEDVFIAVLGEFPGGGRYQTMAEGWYAENEWWYNDHAYFEIDGFKFDPRERYTVTHWMPYPDLPLIEEN